MWSEYCAKHKCIVLKPKHFYLSCILEHLCLSCIFKLFLWFHLSIMVFSQVLMNFKLLLLLFSKSFIIDPSYNNVNFNSPYAIKPTLSPNVILDLVAFISMGNVFQKWKEKVYEEIVACLSRDLTKPIVSVPKKKKNRKIKVRN
jgi:hypothetical protein